MIVHLIGPGGAGKSTTGPPLAEELGFNYIDLDREYLASSDIGADVERRGYKYYVRNNVDLYLSLTNNIQNTVIATSSGFMTYDEAIHPRIQVIHNVILESPATVLLLPSFDYDQCVQATVRRQLSKPHESKSIADQTDRIARRFPIYRAMAKIQVSTDKPTPQVVEEIVVSLAGQF